MEDFNYSEMLTKLNNDRAQTLIKLKAIDMAIEAVSQLEKVELGDLVDLSDPKENPSTPIKIEKKSPYEDYEIEVIQNYDPDLQLFEKLIYALFKKNGAFAQDAANYIFSLDQSVAFEYLKSRFTDIASGLGRAKKLNIKKIGKKYKYSIPEGILNEYYENVLS
jgi:hypothetical protein